MNIQPELLVRTLTILRCTAGAVLVLGMALGFIVNTALDGVAATDLLILAVQFIGAQIGLYLLLSEQIFKVQLMYSGPGCVTYSLIVRFLNIPPEHVVETIGGTFSNSISLSSILILTALGLAITF